MTFGRSLEFWLNVPASNSPIRSIISTNQPSKKHPKTKEIHFFQHINRLNQTNQLPLPETNNKSSLKNFPMVQTQMNSFPFGLQLGPCFKEFVSFAVITLCWLKNGGPGLKMYFNLLKHGDIPASYVIVYIWPLVGIPSFPFWGPCLFSGANLLLVSGRVSGFYSPNIHNF